MPQLERILFVDDDAPVRAAFSRAMRSRHFDIDVADGADSAFAMASETPYAVVVTDYRMPQVNGLELIDRLRQVLPDSSFVLISGECDLDLALEAVNDHQVANVVCKPWDIDEVTSVLRRAQEACWERMSQRQVQVAVVDRTRFLEEQKSRLERAMREAEDVLAELLLNTTDLRSHETKAHCRRVAAYAGIIADAMGLRGKILTSVRHGSLLHDIGQIGMPDAILSKPGPLTAEQWKVMRTHTEMGARLLEGFAQLEGARTLVSQHHERWDGTGYPLGLRGEHIYIGARIFAVADTLDAVLSDRPYRKAAPVQVAVSEIVRCSGTQFDPQVVKAFSSVAPERWLEVRAQFPDPAASPHAQSAAA